MCHYHEREIESEIKQKIVNLYSKALEYNLLRLKKARKNKWIDGTEYIAVLSEMGKAWTLRKQTQILNIFFDNLLCLQSH